MILSFLDELFVVGSGKSDGYSKAELLELSTMTWSTVSDYPWFDAFAGQAATLYIDGNFYIFGGYGYYGLTLTAIGRFNATSRSWFKMGDLATPRRGHGAIFTRGQVLVVGGMGTKKTEKCSFQQDQVNCIEQDPELADYTFYPELIPVDDNFCLSVKK